MSFPGLNLKYSNLKEYIQNIKKLIKRQKKYSKSNGEMALRIGLDKSDYYIKLMTKDKSNIFRAYSDALYFSQTSYNEVKFKMYSFIQKNANIFTKLLKFIGSKYDTAEEYLEELNKSTKEPEVALIILSIIFERNLTVLYYDETFATKKYKLDLGFTKSVFISIIDKSGYFDTVYSKEYIKYCGMVQSILFDLASSIGESGDISEETSENKSLKVNYYK